jgi:hypothetical protein
MSIDDVAAERIDGVRFGLCFYGCFVMPMSIE